MKGGRGSTRVSFAVQVHNRRGNVTQKYRPVSGYESLSLRVLRYCIRNTMNMLPFSGVEPKLTPREALLKLCLNCWRNVNACALHLVAARSKRIISAVSLSVVASRSWRNIGTAGQPHRATNWSRGHSRPPVEFNRSRGIDAMRNCTYNQFNRSACRAVSTTSGCRARAIVEWIISSNRTAGISITLR